MMKKTKKWFNRILGISVCLIGLAMIVGLFILFMIDEEEMIVFSMLYLGIFVSVCFSGLGALLFFQTFDEKKEKNDDVSI